ncbi:MAG TPA: OsmC family protein [Candidatus Dormibacteraeota bacterium]|nr:OsmC family protein [Candidatus Dormibacteraeota bacterium]
MPAEYTYRVSAWWTSGRTGLAKCESSPNTIHFSEAAELGGLQGRWTPEQLLLCSLAGCFTTTFHDVARAAKFEFTDLEVEIEGCVRRNRTAGCGFTEILVRPRLTVHSEELREAGLALLRRAKSICMISRAITVPQTMEPTVETVKMPVEGWSDSEAVAKLGV